ncbi:hypothetical protein ASD94_22355 [Acidovorax sp. Root70]|nr:hypothetical protein ASD94_22355 [Acidovorax sp. Root70]
MVEGGGWDAADSIADRALPLCAWGRGGVFGRVFIARQIGALFVFCEALQPLAGHHNSACALDGSGRVCGFLSRAMGFYL